MLGYGTRLPEARGLGGEGGKYLRGAYLPKAPLSDRWHNGRNYTAVSFIRDVCIRRALNLFWRCSGPRFVLRFTPHH